MQEAELAATIHLLRKKLGLTPEPSGGMTRLSLITCSSLIWLLELGHSQP